MCCCQGWHEGLRADEIFGREASRLQLCWSVDTPVCLGITVCRLCLWGMQTIGTIFGSVVNIFIFADPSGWRAGKSSLPFCLQNNQHRRRKRKALLPLFLNAYPPNTGMTFLRKLSWAFECFIFAESLGTMKIIKSVLRLIKIKKCFLRKYKLVETWLLWSIQAGGIGANLLLMQQRWSFTWYTFLNAWQCPPPPLKSGIKKISEIHNKAFHSFIQNTVWDSLIPPCY